MQTVGDVKLKSTAFVDNRASYGGAVYTTIGKQLKYVVHNCTFIENVATKRAGALFLNGTSVNISHSELTENKCPLGGAIFFIGKMSIFHLVDSKVSKNNNANKSQMTGQVGSAVCFFSAKTAFITRVQFYENGAGGGIYFSSTRGEVHNCEFQNNAGYLAGDIAAMEDNSLLLITSSSFVESDAPDGAALYFFNKHVLIQSCYFGVSPGLRKATPVILGAENIIELRSYSNFFTEQNSNLAPQALIIPFSVAKQPDTTMFFWKTRIGNHKFPVDLQNQFLHDKSNLLGENTLPLITAPDGTNITQVFSQYASGKPKIHYHEFFECTQKNIKS